MTQVTRWPALLLPLAVVAACGSDGPTNGGGNNTLTMAKASPSGDGQCGASGAVLTTAFRVRITQGGNAASGTTVTWTLTGGGSLNPVTSQTGADGVATATLTLPNVAGAVTVQATAAGVSGSPQTFTASVAGAQAGVQVLNNTFNPDNACVTTGGTVTFTWGAGSSGHNVTPVAPAGIPESPGHPGLLNAPNSFPEIFPTAGTFVYFCSAHGTAAGGMRGTITVTP